MPKTNLQRPPNTYNAIHINTIKAKASNIINRNIMLEPIKCMEAKHTELTKITNKKELLKNLITCIVQHSLTYYTSSLNAK